MAFYFVTSFLIEEIFNVFYYANLITFDVMCCANTLVRQKIKNVSASNEVMLLKLGRDVVPYEIYQMVHILVLMATCLISVFCLLKMKYYLLGLNKAKCLVLSKTHGSPTFIGSAL